MTANASPDTLLAPGTAAPDFTLEAAPDRPVTLSSLRGKPVILAFYPADWSPVCGDQMALYNQVLPSFKELGAELLGIAVDSTWCHQAFIADRHLHFDLLADYEPKGDVARAYGAYDTERGAAARALYVIDADGKVAWSYLSPSEVNPGADGILDALEQLAK